MRLQFKYANKVRRKLAKYSTSLLQPIRDRIFVAKFKNNNKRAVNEDYFLVKDIQKKKSDIAVVLHLYYTENWEDVFRDSLLRLEDTTNFDLYITIPDSNRNFGPVIKEVFPDANFLVVPNKGRDVLPFVKAASLLSSLGYTRLLKLHSKKSTHRDLEGNAAESGNDWLTKTVDSLIPKNKETLTKVTRIIKRSDFGVLGPRHYYYPIKMYLTRNRRAMEVLLNDYHDKLFSGSAAYKLDAFGYFGGTMFWVNLETIVDVLDISKDNFEKESGQTDGTLAHALERAFSLLPQLKAKKVFGVKDDGIDELGSAEIPAWYYDDLFISGGKPHISIIVPVYGDWSSLSLNINSLKDTIGNREDVSVYYVNDCGPEANILEDKIQKNISGVVNFYYIRNKKNLGFVKNCNNAVFNIVPQTDDILLLNSDTKVTNNFVNHMRDVLYSEDKIGAVTARSNNATIWSVPMTARLADHRILSYVLYRYIKRSIPSKYISPTVHGFCVLVRREVINKYGLFDEIYGKGYGEENDFAMRIQEAGWKCAVSNYSFVFHYESRSFGNEARRIQIETNEKILIKRYPHYRQRVQEYWDSIKEPLK